MENSLLHNITEDIVKLEQLNLNNEVDSNNLNELLKQLKCIKKLLLENTSESECNKIYTDLKLPIQTLLH